jgi:putative ABC transport system permease protein
MLTFLLVGVVAVLPVVVGIGSMNIMPSVRHRARPRNWRSHGQWARRRDILSQFLIEAIFLSGVGGLMGI